MMLEKLFRKGNATATDKANAEERAQNPYLTARRTWNEHVGAVVSSRNSWQVIGILSLLIALAAVGGVIHVGSQSKFIPYVVEVDKLGNALAAGAINPGAEWYETPMGMRIIHATLAEFIQDARMVTMDVAHQRKAIFRIYAKLSGETPATAKMNEWLNGKADSSPFVRAEKILVSVEIRSVLPQTNETWQIDWTETTRDRQGVMIGNPVDMRGILTIHILPPNPNTTDEKMRMNPMGIYVRDFSWSRTTL
jgi:type IV secretion system protein VirB5